MSNFVPETPTDFGPVLDNFTPTDGDWLPLESLLNRVFSRPVSSTEITAMLRLFERFPTEDGAEIFWSIVHGLEAVPGYESFLADSVRRVPSEFGVLMLGRLLNSGQREIAGTPISALLTSVQSSPNASSSAKRHAHNFQTRHA